MKTRIIIAVFALLMSLSVVAQPPRVRDEARRLTNHVDRKVGLSRAQYDRIYRINLRFAGREISRERRDRDYRNVMSPRQWDRWIGRPAPRRDYRDAPPPRHHDNRGYRGGRDHRRY